MICENCGAEIMCMLDHVTHPCPKSSLEPTFRPITEVDFDEAFRLLTKDTEDDE